MISSYFASIGFTLCALIFMLTVFIMFMTKKRKNNEESKIYFIMLIVILAMLVLEFIVSYTMSKIDSMGLINNILGEIYFFLSYMWVYVKKMFVIGFNTLHDFNALHCTAGCLCAGRRCNGGNFCKAFGFSKGKHGIS